MKNCKQLFPGANTPQGFRSLYHEGLAGLERVFILKGGPGIGKSTLMRKIGAELANFGYATELWQCSSDSSSIDGIICRKLGIAVIDGTAPHIVDPKYPGVCEEIINLGEFWEEEKLRANGTAIISLFKEIAAEFAAGYKHLAKAEENRGECLKICASPYDKRLEQQLLSELFAAEQPLKFFASAITDKGLISYAESITAACRKRYLLQGRQNDNASLLLAAVSEAAQQRGLTVEEYHSPFAPEKMEIVLLPSLSIAVVDMTAPHVKLQPRENDVKKEISLPLPQQENAHEQEYRSAFEANLEKTVECFHRAKEKHDKLEVFYTQAMDFDGVNAKAKELIDKIMRLIKEKQK